MAPTTLTAILDRFQAVLEAAPLSLVASTLPFSHDRQPNNNLADTYWIDDGGMVSAQSVTNDAEVRIDRLTIFIAKPFAFAGVAQFEAMETLLDTIYKYLILDGRAQGFNVEPGGRKVTNPSGTEILIGSLSLQVDYDFSSAV